MANSIPQVIRDIQSAGGGGGTDAATIAAGVDLSGDIESINGKLGDIATFAGSFTNNPLTGILATAGDNTIYTTTASQALWIYGFVIQAGTATGNVVLVKLGATTVIGRVRAPGIGDGVALSFARPLLVPPSTAIVLNLASTESISYSFFNELRTV